MPHSKEVRYFLAGKEVSWEEFMGYPVPDKTSTHTHTFKRYVGLQRVVDYCTDPNCRFEKEVSYEELGDKK